MTKRSITMIKDHDVDAKELEDEGKRLTLNHGNANAIARPKPNSVQEQLEADLLGALQDKHRKLAPNTKAKVPLDMVFNTYF
jgi:hypothetical protein